MYLSFSVNLPDDLSSLFMVGIWLILVFGLCVLRLQNDIIGSKWVRVQTYF